VARVLGYRFGGPGSIPVTTRKKKVVGLGWGSLSLVSTTEELLDRKVAAPVYKTENTAVGIHHADHVAPSICKSWQLLRRQAVVARSGLRPWSLFVCLFLFFLVLIYLEQERFSPVQPSQFENGNTISYFRSHHFCLMIETNVSHYVFMMSCGSVVDILTGFEFR
jgi:hypothetical protein